MGWWTQSTPDNLTFYAGGVFGDDATWLDAAPIHLSVWY
jgi:hypothetical protein